jgi:hypothetical protein
MSKIETITARKNPCNCGCKGQDAWHKPSFKRAVSNFVTIEAIANETDIPQMVVVATGVARFPWGYEPVVAEVMSFDGQLFSYRPEWRLAELRD